MRVVLFELDRAEDVHGPQTLHVLVVDG